MQFRVFVNPVDQTRSDGLDALRFILAMWVLLAHAVGWGVYVGALNAEGMINQAGYMLVRVFQKEGETHPAVLAFIVLSGYCIHRNGFRFQRNFYLKEFGIRRFFRIYPVYLLATGFGVIFWYLNSNANIVATKALTGTEAITWMGIVVKLTGISSFVPSLHTAGWQGNAPLTTAIVEAWLYVFYAFVVWYVARGYSLQKLLLASIVSWLLTFRYVHLNQENVGWWHNGSFVSFALFWWIGVFFVENNLRNRKKYTVYKILFSSVCMMVIGHLGAGLIHSELRKIGLAIIFAMTIQWVDRNWRSTAMYSKGGQAGYSIYALHAPLLILFFVNGAPFVFAVCVTLFIAIACHFLYEQPLIDIGKRLSIRVANSVNPRIF